jgi:hypothetical protein
MKLYPDNWRVRLTTGVVSGACIVAVLMLGPVIDINGFGPHMLSIVVAIIVGNLLGLLVCRLLFRPSSGGPPEKKKKGEKTLIPHFSIAIISIAFCVLVGAAPIVLYSLGFLPIDAPKFPSEANEFGDSFGFMNAFVSACAFAALIITMIWQHGELKEHSLAIRKQTDELEKSREEQEKTRQAIESEVRELRKSLAANIHSHIYDSNASLLRLVVERPELRRYIYGNERLPEDSPSETRQQVLAACELFCDNFEFVSIQLAKVVNDPTYQGINYYITDVISSSPEIRNHIRRNATWTTAVEFKKLVNSACLKAGDTLIFNEETNKGEDSNG